MGSFERGRAQANLESELRGAFSTVRLLRLNPDRTWRTVWAMPIEEFHYAGYADNALEPIKIALRPYTSDGSGAWHVSIPPVGPQGFAIDMHGDGDRIRVSFGGLDEEFATLSSAMIWVGRALSSDYQLRTLMYGGLAYEWRLEPVDTGQRGNSLITGHPVFLRRLLPKSTVVRRNVFPMQ